MKTEMYKFLQDRGVSRKQADEWNIVYHADRDRIMFPIHDEDGMMVGATWRVGPWSPMNAPKYINSKNSDTFDKSKLLYGLHKAKQDIVLEDSVIIVEGQFDVILSHINGFENTVAISGTLLTQQQIHTLSKYTKNIILSFDNDEAGKKATDRSYNNICEYNRFMEMFEALFGSTDNKAYDEIIAVWSDWIEFELTADNIDDEIKMASSVRENLAKRFTDGDTTIICVLDFLSDRINTRKRRVEMLKKMDGSDNLVDVQSLKENVKIETLLEGAKLITSGANQKKCLCPIHNENTPSFTIYEDTNTWWCYGCSEGSSNIDLIMKLHKLSTGEAIKYLKQYL